MTVRPFITIATLIASCCLILGCSSTRKSLEEKTAQQASTIERQQLQIANLERIASQRLEEIGRKDRDIEGYLGQLEHHRVQERTCVERLNTAEITNVLELQAKLAGCESTRTEAEKKALYQGMLVMWESLSVSAKPYTEGVVFKDHYLKVNVHVKDRVVYSFQFETEKRVSGFVESLSAAVDIAGLIALLR